METHLCMHTLRYKLFHSKKSMSLAAKMVSWAPLFLIHTLGRMSKMRVMMPA